MKVMLAAGGSGGHIFPSVALASELEKKGVKDVTFVASKRRLDRSILSSSGYRCFYLSANPMPYGYNPLKALVFLVKLFADAVRSVFIIRKVRPEVVVGFGGYSSGAVVRCAKFFRVPVIIHEQNLVPGRANRMLASYADRIAVTFAESAEGFGPAAERVVYTGNPLRPGLMGKSREEAVTRLGLEPGKKTVLVMGGSQGSTFLNRTAGEAADLIREDTAEAVQFIHLTGEKDFGEVKSYYREKGIPAKVYSFLEGIELAYAACDVAVSRSGAAAIFELAHYGKPMLLVPYPSEKNNQRRNAEYFSEKGAAIYKEEKDLTAEGLAREIRSVLRDSSRYDAMSRSASLLADAGAGKRLAEEVIKLAEK